MKIPPIKPDKKYLDKLDRLRLQQIEILKEIGSKLSISEENLDNEKSMSTASKNDLRWYAMDTYSFDNKDETNIRELMQEESLNVKVKMFKALRGGNRYNTNQKIWIVQDYPNYIEVVHKFRGSGRYVNARLDKDSTIIGEIKEIEVDKEFATRHNLQTF